MLSNLIPTTGTAEQIEDAAFGFLQDSDGRELARAVEDERGVVCLDIGQMTNSDAYGALVHIQEYLTPDVFKAYVKELKS
jgi:hypothetical protein